MFLLCSRTIEMTKESRFSTRTLPLRSNSTPRGARSGSVRWWLFSAISRNFSCCTTWKYQNASASAAKTTVTATWTTISRVASLRRSSGCETGPGSVEGNLSMNRYLSTEN